MKEYIWTPERIRTLRLAVYQEESVKTFVKMINESLQATIGYSTYRTWETGKAFPHRESREILDALAYGASMTMKPGLIDDILA